LSGEKVLQQVLVLSKEVETFLTDKKYPLVARFSRFRVDATSSLPQRYVF
jgi:hypothetical protein